MVRSVVSVPSPRAALPSLAASRLSCFSVASPPEEVGTGEEAVSGRDPWEEISIVSMRVRSSTAAVAPSRSTAVTGSAGPEADAPFVKSCPTSSPRTLAAVGRCSGSLLRHASNSGRRLSGTSVRSGGSLRMRWITVCTLSAVNGPLPVAANAMTPAQANMSAGGPISPPRICSGAM
ncbi:hypothetical protein NORO109296_13105 [Nocardiopsis rhodophaea]